MTIKQCDRCFSRESYLFLLNCKTDKTEWSKEICSSCHIDLVKFIEPMPQPYIPTVEDVLDGIEEANSTDFRESKETAEEKVNAKIGEYRRML